MCVPVVIVFNVLMFAEHPDLFNKVLDMTLSLSLVGYHLDSTMFSKKN